MLIRSPRAFSLQTLSVFLSLCLFLPVQLSFANEEVALGQQINQEILASFRPYTEPKLLGYIDGIGQNLALHAKRHDFPYQFVVLYNDKIYATSSPGGFIYLTTGMVYFLGSESELAGVLAHEIGELQYKNPKLSKTRKVMEKIINGGAMAAPAFGQFGALALAGIALVKMASDRKEVTPEKRLYEADRKGLGYMVDAGYDPQGLVDLQRKFLSSHMQTHPYFYDYYQSRPITEERIEKMTEAFKKLDLQNKTFLANRDNFFEKTKGLREIYAAGTE